MPPFQRIGRPESWKPLARENVAGGETRRGKSLVVCMRKGKRFSAAAEEQQMPFLEGGRPRSQAVGQANHMANMAWRLLHSSFLRLRLPSGLWWGTKLT
ncbi:hypothetical protein V8C44DRAFT_326282 [Trichoderma aethiopicum]